MTSSRASGAFLGKWRIFLLILLFLITWLVAMVYTLPASLVWDQASRYVTLPRGVSIEAVGGTVWDGEALLEAAGRSVRIEWAVRSPRWGQQELPIHWQVATRHSRITGTLSNQGREELVLDVDEGHVDLGEFSALARANGLTLSGEVTIERLKLVADQAGWNEVAGLARWSGGPVAWNMPTGQGRAVMPPMVARLDRQGQAARALVREEATATSLITATLERSGWAQVRIHRHLLALSGIQIGGNGSPESVVFQVKHRVMPALGS